MHRPVLADLIEPVVAGIRQADRDECLSFLGFVVGTSAERVGQETVAHYLTEMAAGSSPAPGNAYDLFVQVIGRLVDTKDSYTSAHQERVRRIGLVIGGHVGMSKDQLIAMEMAALVHDIGKISVPSSILLKPSQLSTVEKRLMREHPIFGAELISHIEFPWPLQTIVAQHHERCDGSGYPRGLVEKDLLLESQVLALADTIEAMTAPRPYRSSYDMDSIIAEIKRERGRGFNADLADGAIDCLVESVGIPSAAALPGPVYTS